VLPIPSLLPSHAPCTSSSPQCRTAVKVVDVFPSTPKIMKGSLIFIFVFLQLTYSDEFNL
jgi:hypothetical protein